MMVFMPMIAAGILVGLVALATSTELLRVVNDLMAPLGF